MISDLLENNRIKIISFALGAGFEMSEKLVWNAILNFMKRAIKAGNRSTEIVKKTIEFFKKDDINDAKTILWEAAKISTRVSIKVNPHDNVIEMIRVFEDCDKKNIDLPTFVIVEPAEVLLCSWRSVRRSY